MWKSKGVVRDKSPKGWRWIARVRAGRPLRSAPTLSTGGKPPGPFACRGEGKNAEAGSVISRAVSTPHLARDLTLYLLARLGLIAVVATVLVLVNVPLLVSIAVAVVVGLPLGLLTLRKLNARVTAGLAARNERRAGERAKLRAQLRGDE